MNFFILIIHNPYQGSQEVPQKFWSGLVQLFWRLLDTHKQKDRQAKYIDTSLSGRVSFESNLPGFVKSWEFFSVSKDINLNNFS